MFRLRDILLATLALAIFSWLFLLIVIALAITQGKVFFTQIRTGKGEKPFRLIKFSTLRDIGPGEREEDDQRYRLTPVGKLIRRFSLDEFPNLINVITGEMSLVGPRPLIHDYLPLYSPEQKKRFQVRPGITGWAQVNGRNAITFTERFRLDVWYVENRSISLDFKIIGKTFSRIFSGKGVYADDQTTMPRFDGTN